MDFVPSLRLWYCVKCQTRNWVRSSICRCSSVEVDWFVEDGVVGWTATVDGRNNAGGGSTLTEAGQPGCWARWASRKSASCCRCWFNSRICLRNSVLRLFNVWYSYDNTFIHFTTFRSPDADICAIFFQFLNTTFHIKTSINITNHWLFLWIKTVRWTRIVLRNRFGVLY